MTEDYLRAADEELADAREEPMSLAEFVDTLDDHPTRAAHASRYLLDAIEHFGTREVVEDGEERERYRFFDDPANDGEHAVLGNTELLNGFVDDLRSVAAGRGKEEKILWFTGPTATGKSEFKRCLVNGLRAYSKTEGGRRYTVEWNVSAADADPGLTYGGGDTRPDDDEWYESPVQSNPLAVFPPETRERILDAVAEEDDVAPPRADTGLDPFCREAYDFLEEQYRREGRDDRFAAVTDPAHLRVKNYVMDVGQGIGVLHSEDAGSPKERLVGSWMPEQLARLDSRGRKNPQAFSYDGVLSQGNSGITVVEDAAQHADLLRKLLNVPDEGAVKLDKGIHMDVDTQLLVISNHDLEAQLNQHADKQRFDPLKALKRRLDRREFTYLTNASLEAQLLRRELLGETRVWTEAEEESRTRERVAVTVESDGERRVREFAPHAVAAASLYDVVTRLHDDDLPSGMDLVDKALLYDRGYLRDGDERVTLDDVEFGDREEGQDGVPVTFTRDVLSDLLHAKTDRHHPDLPVEDVVMPRDVLNAMVDGLAEAPVFSDAERERYEDRVVAVKDEVFARQEDDVVDAIMFERTVDEATVEEYVEHVYAWATDGAVEGPDGEDDPDPLKMKVFETEHLGRFDEDAYDGTDPSKKVREFREGKILTALNRHAWEHRTDDFRVQDVDLSEIPVIETVLDATDWDDVARAFPDLDPDQWDDPPEGTETERVKEATVERLVADFGYTPASAELTSRHVMNQVSYRWD
ncbi:PrkA family serine protein kinase [Halospeciosus flavus]|uniref:PrkA family serine protein kinase n=1 Tax=Halospeciosus flavus TaxID=3032283 RepID=A0ABD5Z479_9EURY|nr:kinase anchor protein [Halospeciosus flavus]